MFLLFLLEYVIYKCKKSKMYEDVVMAECQNPVKLGGCMQARQGWWHITKCLTIVTLCLKDVVIGVTMVKHFVICRYPCLVRIQPPSFTGFWHSAIPTSSYNFMKMIFYTCFTSSFTVYTHSFKHLRSGVSKGFVY